MKKILFLIALFGFLGAYEAQAQAFTQRMSVSAAEDTLTNTDTAYLTTSVTGSYDLQFKLTVTKISGTVGGAVILQGSNDNSTWFSLNSGDNGAADTQYQDTATVTNGTASYWWNLPKVNATYQYYRLRHISSGTQVSAPVGTLYYRK